MSEKNGKNHEIKYRLLDGQKYFPSHGSWAIFLTQTKLKQETHFRPKIFLD